MPQVTASLVVEILTFLAEVAVVCVIYYEVEHDRQSRFLASSQDAGARRARRTLYGAFFEANPSLNSVSMDEARENLLKLIEQNEKLRTACTDVTTFVNDLGFAATRLFARKRVYLDLFPQGPVFVWLTVGEARFESAQRLRALVCAAYAEIHIELLGQGIEGKATDGTAVSRWF
jgi:hypothetical protein